MSEQDLSPEGVDAEPIDAPEEQAVEQEAEQVEVPAAPNLEDVASGMGWAPQEQWRGDPDKWRPAHEFVERTAEINGKLSARLKGVEQQLSTIAKTNSAMTDRALATQKEQLHSEWQEAVEMGDHTAVAKAQQGLQELQQTEQPQAPAPETQAFMERNKWMTTDQEAAKWAQTRAGQLANQGVNTAKQLEVVEREAKDLYPEYFTQPKKPAPAPLSKPGNRGGKVAAKSFATLPKEAQAAALEFEKKGISKEEYTRNYYEQMEGSQ